jgi:hypothetical protein
LTHGYHPRRLRALASIRRSMCLARTLGERHRPLKGTPRPARQGWLLRAAQGQGGSLARGAMYRMLAPGSGRLSAGSAHAHAGTHARTHDLPLTCLWLLRAMPWHVAFETLPSPLSAARGHEPAHDFVARPAAPRGRCRPVQGAGPCRRRAQGRAARRTPGGASPGFRKPSGQGLSPGGAASGSQQSHSQQSIPERP